MKARVAGPELADALAWITRAATGARVTLPALSGVHVHAEGDRLTLTGTDLEATGRVHIDADVGDAGEVLVSAARFAAVARSLGSRAVDLSLNKDRLDATATGSRFTLRTMHVEDYPRLPDPPAALLSIPADKFAAALDTVLPGAATDPARPVLTGVYAVSNGGALTLETTDSYRYHRHLLDVDPGDFDALVPARVIGEIRKLAERHDDGDIDISVDDKQFAVTVGDRFLSTRLIEGTFPAAQHLVPAPDKFVHRFAVEAEALRDAVKRIVVVSTDQNPVVALDISADGLGISVQDTESGDGETSVDIDLQTSTTLRVGASARYLVDAIDAVHAERVVLSFIDELKPYTVTPVGDDPYSPFALVMPVRL